MRHRWAGLLRRDRPATGPVEPGGGPSTAFEPRPEKTEGLRTFVVLLVLAFAAELSLAHRAALWGASPDAVLVLVVLGSLGLPPGSGTPRAFCAGLLTDVFFGRRLGAFALSYALCAEALAAMRPYFFGEHPATRIIFLAGAALGVETLSFALNSAAEGALVPGGLFLCLRIALLTWLFGACVVGALEIVKVVRR